MRTTWPTARGPRAAAAPNHVGWVEVDNKKESVRLQLGGYVAWQGAPGRHVFTLAPSQIGAPQGIHIPVQVATGKTHFVRIGPGGPNLTIEEVAETEALNEISKCRGNATEFEAGINYKQVSAPGE